MSALPPILEYLNAGGVLAVFLLIGWGFYTERLRFGSDFNDLEQKLLECHEEIAENRVEIRQLWVEKVEDKEEKAELARAYLKIREHDKS